MTKTRTLLIAAMTAAITAATPSLALAASTTVTGTVSGSTLSLTTSATPSFTDNLDQGDQTQTYSVPSTVQDTRGSGAGWNLTVTSTQFTTTGANPTTLATTASSLTGVTSACVAGGTCTNPSNAVTYPITVPAASTAPTAVKFFNAATSSGLGKFTVTPTVGVAVPQSTPAGSYTSTLTLSIVSGP